MTNNVLNEEALHESNLIRAGHENYALGNGKLSKDKGIIRIGVLIICVIKPELRHANPELRNELSLPTLKPH